MDEETQLVRESDRIDHRINYVPFILGIFAFFYFFRPSSPFLVEYLVQYKGLDVNTVIFEILPIWSYSYVIVQLVTGFATEWLNHKVIIIVGLFVAQISEIFVLVSDKSKTYLLQISQGLFAFVMASHQSFFGLQYHLLPREKYQSITSITRTAILFGFVGGAVVGQTLYFFKVDLTILFYITIGAVVPCLIIACIFFPTPSKYSVPMVKKEGKMHTRFKNFILEILGNYKHYEVFFWSMTTITATSIHGLCLTYYQPLFKVINSNKTYNGIVIGVAYAIAGFVSLVPGRIDKILDRVGRTIAIIFSFGMSICLLFMGMEFTSIWMVYTLFIIYHAGFEFIYVCCLALIAKRLKVTRFAAIFALNAVAQNVTQMIIQAIIQVLELNPRKQFIAFSICAFGFSCLFTVLNVGYYIHKLLPKFKKEQDDNNTEICTENTLILGDDTN